VAIGRLGRRLRPTRAGSGLTPTQVSVLFTLVRHGPLPLAELAERETLNPTMLSRVLGGLCEAGSRRAPRIPAIAGRARGGDLGRPTDPRADPSRAQRGGSQPHLAELTPQERRAIVEALPALEALAERMR